MKKQSVSQLLRQGSFPWKIVIRSLCNPALRRSGMRCIITVFRRFFLPQFRTALFPGLIPVSRADHPLDEKIPFNPRRIAAYLDFVAYWIRALGYILEREGPAAGAEFVDAISGLYSFAAGVYQKNLSTTRRPRYLRTFRFFLIHLVDPHLMCIPSLHIMIVIETYTRLLKYGDRAALETVYRQGLDITEAVLYIKQHSVNCISAAMYAMSRLAPGRFTPEEAKRFALDIFSEPEPEGKAAAGEDKSALREHIYGLYLRFLQEGKNASHWTVPLLDFLKALPRARKKILLSSKTHGIV